MRRATSSSPFATRPVTVQLDPVTLAVVWNSLVMVASEMDLAQEKTSFSPIISEAMDRANGIYAAHNGELIVQGARGLPLFVGVMQSTVGHVIERQAERGAQMSPGDVIIINDPYLGGTHLMDVRLVKPVISTRAGCGRGLPTRRTGPISAGRSPGGFSSDTWEVHQEGLRLPPIRIAREGKLDEDLLALILANCRVPQERVGDFKAQMAALNVGERRLTVLLDRYGVGRGRDGDRAKCASAPRCRCVRTSSRCPTAGTVSKRRWTATASRRAAMGAPRSRGQGIGPVPRLLAQQPAVPRAA